MGGREAGFSRGRFRPGAALLVLKALDAKAKAGKSAVVTMPRRASGGAR
jgi:hypothetical protein